MLCLQTIRDFMLLLLVLVLVHGQKIVDIKIDQLTRHARNLEFQKKRINILLPFS